jgi:hypothetical protein
MPLTPAERPRISEALPISGPAERWIVRGVLAGLAGVAAALALATLWWPLGWDQGVFAWIGDTIAHGGMPYRDAWDVKGPATGLVYAAVQTAFGRGPWPIRVFDLGLCAATLPFLFRALGRLLGRPAALYGMLLALLWYFSQGFWDTAQPDGWAALLLLPVVAPLLGREKQPGAGYYLGAGALVGLCAFLKPTYAVLLLLPAWALMRSPPPRPEARGRSAAMLGLGFLVIVAGFVSWFLARAALGSLWQEYVVGNLHRATSPGWVSAEVMAPVYRYFSRPQVVIAVTAALAGGALLKRDRWADFEILMLWVVVSIVCVVTQGRWEGYLLHLVEFPLICLAVFGVATAARAGEPTAPLAAACALSLAVASAGAAARPVGRWARMELGRTGRDAYAAGFDNLWLGFSFHADVAVAQRVRTQTSPDDVVLALEDPLVNYLAARRSIGRYTSPGPAWVNTSDLGPRGREFLRDVAASRPKYVVIGPPVAWVPGTLWKVLDDHYPAPFVALLRREYTVDTIIGGSTLLRHGSADR